MHTHTLAHAHSHSPSLLSWALRTVTTTRCMFRVNLRKFWENSSTRKRERSESHAYTTSTSTRTRTCRAVVGCARSSVWTSLLTVELSTLPPCALLRSYSKLLTPLSLSHRASTLSVAPQKNHTPQKHVFFAECLRLHPVPSRVLLAPVRRRAVLLFTPTSARGTRTVECYGIAFAVECMVADVRALLLS